MQFAPLEALLGGVVIGLAVFWNARLHGVVTGVSGTLRKAASLHPSDVFFTLGLLSAGALLKPHAPPALATDVLHVVPIARILFAGLLVGAGTYIGNGCTSGHAVCGLSRFSRRSYVATLTFMTVATFVATLFSSADVYKLPPAPLPASLSAVPLPTMRALLWIFSAILLTMLAPPILARVALHAPRKSWRSAAIDAGHALLGLCFGTGLIISGMASPSKTATFFDGHSNAWDPSLVFVFIGTLPVAVAGFRPIMRGVKPMLAGMHSLPTRCDIERRLVAGAAIFGLGWGLLGFCPAPAVVYFAAFPTSRNAGLFGLAAAAGTVLSMRLVEALDRRRS